MAAGKHLIAGVTGRVGTGLAEFLLSKDYIANGAVSSGSSFGTQRIDDIYMDRNTDSPRFLLHYDDQSDANSLTKLISGLRATEM